METQRQDLPGEAFVEGEYLKVFGHGGAVLDTYGLRLLQSRMMDAMHAMFQAECPGGLGPHDAYAARVSMDFAQVALGEWLGDDDRTLQAASARCLLSVFKRWGLEAQGGPRAEALGKVAQGLAELNALTEREEGAEG